MESRSYELKSEFMDIVEEIFAKVYFKCITIPARLPLNNMIEAAGCIQPPWIFEHLLLRYTCVPHTL